MAEDALTPPAGFRMEGTPPPPEGFRMEGAMQPDLAKSNKTLAGVIGDNIGKAGQTVADMATVYGPVEALMNAGTGLLFGFPAAITGAIAGLSNKYLMSGQADPKELMDT